jgi:phosphoribosylglycinamide formyltransferase 1
MKFVLLGSGRGSNALAILKAWKSGHLAKAQPVALFCDHPGAPFLEHAIAFGLPGENIDPGPRKASLSPESERALAERIRFYEADYVVLAGFMRILHKPFLDAFPMRVINLHPSLLPSFKGLEAIRQAWEYGVRVTGCTVHYVTAAVDGGPIIDQEAVRREPDDTLDSLTEKVHAAEHRLLPDVIARLSRHEI